MKRLFGSCLLARIGLAAAFFGGMLWIIGCGGKNNPVKPDGDSNSLTLPSGQAWIDTGSGSTGGIIFTADGRFFEISKGTGTGTNNWYMEREGTYTTADDIEIKLAFSESDTGALLFRLSKGGDTLTLYRATSIRPPSGYNNGGVYTKTSGVNFKIPPPNPGTGGNLVLGSKEAWINTEEGMGIGFIFWSDSTVSMIGGANGVWVLSNEVGYSTKDGHIIWSMSTPWGDVDTVTYTVSGNSLAITWHYNTIAFTKTSNVSISAPTGGNLVLSQGQAWVFKDFGLIFESDGKVSVISSEDGLWDLDDVGTYTARGSNINIKVRDMVITGTYTVSGNGNTLIVTLNGQTIAYAKKSNISITTYIGGNLVLPSGQAWTYHSDGDNYYGMGYIFQSNGQALEIFMRDSGDSWERWDRIGRYTTSDAHITITWENCYRDECHTTAENGTYSVYGKSLVLRLDGWRKNLTITSGVNIPTDSLSLLKKPVAPAPKARSGMEILTFRRH